MGMGYRWTGLPTGSRIALGSAEVLGFVMNELKQYGATGQISAEEAYEHIATEYGLNTGLDNNWFAVSLRSVCRWWKEEQFHKIQAELEIVRNDCVNAIRRNGSTAQIETLNDILEAENVTVESE